MAPKRAAASTKTEPKDSKPKRATNGTNANSKTVKKAEANKSTKPTKASSSKKQTVARPEKVNGETRRPRDGAAKATQPASRKRRNDEELEDASTTTKKRKVTAPKPVLKQPAEKPPKPAVPKIILNTVPSGRLEAFVFGSGDAGELGLGPKIVEVRSPRLNDDLSGVVQIALGGMHGIALTPDNKILTWGGNDLGVLGRDTKWDGKMKDIDEEEVADEESDVNPYESKPMSIPASKFATGTVFTQVAAGDSSSFVLTDEGLVYGWGIFRNSRGNFGFNIKPGNKIDKEPQLEPKLISELKNIKQIAVGGDHALALDKKGVVYAWGAGEQSQLARRLVERHEYQSLIPTPVALPKTIVSISACANHSFAVDKTGKVYSWGLNNFGQCGIPRNAGDSEAMITKPERVRGLAQPVKMVAGGNHHSIAVTESGDCMVWGRLDGYQTGIKVKSLPLEDDTQIMKSESGRPSVLLQPTRVPGVPFTQYVAAGSDHCIAITQDGEVYSWGFNTSSQCGQGPEKEENAGKDDDGSDDDDLEVPDEIKEATLVGCRAIDEKKMIWAGAGGQFSAVAAKAN